MNISSLFSAGRAPESPEQVQELLKNMITITNYLPGIRSSLGWRGVFRIPCESECWTFKSAGFDGIFGLDYADCGERDRVFKSSFNIFYFPDPEEELIEKFPLNGAVYAYRDNYRELIRSFPDHPEFFNYFFIGKLIITFNSSDSVLTMDIESLSDDIIISEDGVAVQGADGIKFIVEPGEPEQAVPSFHLSSAVFNLLASSLSFHLGGIVPAVRLRQYPGEKRYLKKGTVRSEKNTEDVKFNTLAVMFNWERDEALQEFFTDGPDRRCISETLWREGLCEVPPEFKDFIFMNPGCIKNVNTINKGLLGIEAKVPLYIVTGFLGAGKTSFIRNFLEYHSQKYLFGAVIQNELGEAGLDGKLISDECRVIEMDEGCVCCTLSGNLRRGINSVISEFTPDFIILETTGAANPMNLVSEIHDLRDLVRFDSVTTIVDAQNITGTLKEYDISRDQVMAADIIILNKTDGMESAEIKELETDIGHINKRALVYAAEFGNINPLMLYDQEITDGRSNTAMNFSVRNHKNHSDERLMSFMLILPVEVSRDLFIDKIEGMPFNVFRIKGIVRFRGEETPSVFQYVRGRYEISIHGENREPERPFLVFIGKDIDEVHIREYFRF